MRISGGSQSDRKSTSGYVVQVFGSTISWCAKKQSTVALSTAEAEYMAISLCLQEVKWLHALLEELGLRSSCHDASSSLGSSLTAAKSRSCTVLYTDNRAAKSLCEVEADSTLVRSTSTSVITSTVTPSLQVRCVLNGARRRIRSRIS